MVLIFGGQENKAEGQNETMAIYRETLLTFRSCQNLDIPTQQRDI
jgi:hypothetical protein